MKLQGERFKNIEFLRIIGCIAIIMLHIFLMMKKADLFQDISIYHHFRNMTSNGQKAVDLFFIISGFLFAYKLNLHKSLWEFVKGKLLRFYPVFIFVILLYLLTSFTGILEFKFYDNVLSLLCLDGTGLTLSRGNVTVFWYVSSLIWVLALYYYLLQNYEKKTVNLFIAISIFFCYGFMIHAKGGAINNPLQTFYNIFNVQMLRAFGGIGIGYFIGEWYKNNKEQIKKIMLTTKQKLLVTGLEFLCLFYIINNLILRIPKFRNNLFFIVTFAAIIVLFLAKKGYISNYLEKDFWQNISKYTYSLYLSHTFVITVFLNYFWKINADSVESHPLLNLGILIVCILILGVLTYHLVELPAAKYFKKRTEI